MTFLSSFATIIGIVASIGMIPQVIKIYKRKSAKDISVSSNLFMLFAGIIWILYGIEINSIPLISTNLTGSITIFIIIIGWFLYGHTEKT